MSSVCIPDPVLPGQLVNLIRANLFPSEALCLYCWALTDIDWGTDSLHCAILQSRVVLTLLLWICAGFHFTHVGLMLAEWNYTQRSGLINPQYKDGSKCQRVKDSLQNYHTLFSGLKLSHLTLLAVSGRMKSCICPGRSNSWASSWFHV